MASLRIGCGNSSPVISTGAELTVAPLSENTTLPVGMVVLGQPVNQDWQPLLLPPNMREGP